MLLNVLKGSQRYVPFVAMDYRNATVWVNQLVMLCPALDDEPGLGQPLDEFPCCHVFFIRIMRMIGNAF